MRIIIELKKDFVKLFVLRKTIETLITQFFCDAITLNVSNQVESLFGIDLIHGLRFAKKRKKK